jgi:type IV secretion system protein TrbC
MRVNYTYIFVMLAVAVGLFCLLSPDYAMASSQNEMPWDGSIKTLARSITGPIAYGVALMGVTVAGLLLLWGGEIGEFTRRVIMLVLVVSLIFGAASVIATMQETAERGGYGGGSEFSGALIR